MATTPAKRPRGRPKKQPVVAEPSRQHIATEYGGRYYCCRCGNDYSRQRSFFPAATSPLWRANNGYLPVCRTCVEEMFRNYSNSLGGDEAALKRICMKFDIYWSEKAYEAAIKTGRATSIVTEYIGRSNLSQFLGKTYDDTVSEEEENDVAKDDYETVDQDSCEQNKNTEDEIDQADIEMWGEGYSADFYKNLNRRYDSWSEGSGDLTPAEKSLYRNICLLEEMIARGGAEGAPIDKYMSQYNNLIGSVGKKPSQKKSDLHDAEIDSTPMGVWAYRFENLRPLPEIDPELKDQDHIIAYTDTWVRGHLAKMMGKKNAFSRLYDAAIEKLRVDNPDYADEEDEDLLFDVFGGDDDE